MAYTLKNGKELVKDFNKAVYDAVFDKKGVEYLKKAYKEIFKKGCEKIENLDYAFRFAEPNLGYSELMQGFSLAEKGFAPQALELINKGVKKAEGALVHNYLASIEPENKELTDEEKANRNLEKILKDLGEESQTRS